MTLPADPPSAAPAPNDPATPAAPIRQALLGAWQAIEARLDRLTSPALNPLRHLGSLGFLCFWALAASGIYLYAVIDTSASGAYASIERLGHWPWIWGGWLRSAHRYAADALVVVMLLHLLREWLLGHFAAFRRFSWLTGVPLIVFAFISAIGGFWINWNQLGQFSATSTAEWLDSLPLLAAPLARNFLTAGAISDRLFSLFVFVHLGVALLMVFGLWFHIQRLPRARVFPPAPITAGLLAMLVLLAALRPVASGAPADVGVLPALADYDWLLLFIHPLMLATSGQFTWLLVGGTLLWLLALPFLPARTAPIAIAQVDPDNCSGCRRCVDDCPYGAISMVAHPNGKPGHELALVHADRCAGCGICAGACPSSTPFRHIEELVTGIDLPELPVNVLRQRLRQGLERSSSPRPLVVLRCAHGPDPGLWQDGDLVSLDLICAGQLPPSFVEYALRDGAAGVLLATCADGHCLYRDGQALTRERLLRQREPHLRRSTPGERWQLVQTTDAGALSHALNALRDRVRTLEDARPALLAQD